MPANVRFASEEPRRGPPRFAQGDFVWINYWTAQGEKISRKGTVLIVSGNGRSVAVTWNGPDIDGHLGMMPILWDDGRFISIATKCTVELVRRAHAYNG